mgnify:FL=1
MAAGGTGLTRISRIDKNYRDTLEPSLVFDKPFQLVKSPLAENLALGLSNRRPESFQVLQGDCPLCLQGQRDYSFRDDMIRMTFKSSFFAGVFFKMALGRLRAAALELALEFCRLLTNVIHFFARKKFAIGSGRDVGDSEIDAERSFWGKRSSVGNSHDASKIKVSPEINEISLSPDFGKIEFGIRTDDEGHPDPSFYRQDGNGCQALKRQNPGVVLDGGQFSEPMKMLPFRLIGFGNFGDCANGHLSGKAESFPDDSIAQPMDSNLAEFSVFESHPGNIIASRINRFHCLQKNGLLIGRWKKLDFDRQVHALIIEHTNPYVKEAALLPGLKTGVSAPESL